MELRHLLEVETVAFGSIHPDVATTHHNIGAVLTKLGRFEEAEVV